MEAPPAFSEGEYARSAMTFRLKATRRTIWTPKDFLAPVRQHAMDCASVEEPLPYRDQLVALQSVRHP